jgi:hypothetical protein
VKAKLIGIPLAGLLLVGGATAVLAQPGGVAGGASSVGTVVDRAGGLLEDVLGDLVDDGTLTQEQADAVTDGVETRREELRTEFETLREQMRGFLEDDTLSADELAQLPEDHPLRNLDQYLEDGQLTEDELRELRPLGRGGHHGRGGFGPGGFGPGALPGSEPRGDGDAAPEATEEPAATS